MSPPFSSANFLGRRGIFFNFRPIFLQFPSKFFPNFLLFLPFWWDIFLLEKYITGLKMSRKCSSSSFLPEKIPKNPENF